MVIMIKSTIKIISAKFDNNIKLDQQIDEKYIKSKKDDKKIVCVPTHVPSDQIIKSILFK